MDKYDVFATCVIALVVSLSFRLYYAEPEISIPEQSTVQQNAEENGRKLDLLLEHFENNRDESSPQDGGDS